MYWNEEGLGSLEHSLKVEPQHKMYWNICKQAGHLCANLVEPQHKMYWNSFGWVS